MLPLSFDFIILAFAQHFDCHARRRHFSLMPSAMPPRRA